MRASPPTHDAPICYNDPIAEEEPSGAARGEKPSGAADEEPSGAAEEEPSGSPPGKLDCIEPCERKVIFL